MAQQTALTVYALPGMVQSFVAKGESVVPAWRIHSVEQDYRTLTIDQETRILAAIDTRTEVVH